MVLATGNSKFANRTSHRFATYNGDARGSIGEIMGPNTLHEMMTVVSADYDPETNKTRLGFDFTRITDYPNYKDPNEDR